MSRYDQDTYRNDHQDYRYSQQAQDRDLRIIWKCDYCGNEREDYPGWNEGGQCSRCGGEYFESGESYARQPW